MINARSAKMLFFILLIQNQYSAVTATPPEGETVIVRPRDNKDAGEIEAIRKSLSAQTIATTLEGKAQIWELPPGEPAELALRRLTENEKLIWAVKGYDSDSLIRDTNFSPVALYNPVEYKDIPSKQILSLRNLYPALKTTNVRVSQVDSIKFYQDAFIEGFSGSQDVAFQLPHDETVRMRRTNVETSDTGTIIWQGEGTDVLVQRKRDSRFKSTTH